MFKDTVRNLVRVLATQLIHRRNPVVIGVTGSVGKTTTRESIAHLLSGVVSGVYTPNRNYNNEWGMALAVLLEKDYPSSSPVFWIKLLVRYLTLMCHLRRYPSVLVLEYGIDRPGDMDRLLKLARPDIAVITNISLSHYEFFEDPDKIAQEKFKLANALDIEGIAILNIDSAPVLKQLHHLKRKVISYSQESEATVSLVESKVNFPDFTTEIIWKSTLSGRVHTARLPGVGRAFVSSALGAIATGIAMGLDEEALNIQVSHLRPRPGRGRVLKGQHSTWILDDSYNASPESTNSALEIVAQYSRGRKIIMLGDMLELGSLATSEHEKIGEKVACINPDLVVWVGPLMHIAAESARRAGLNSARSLSFERSGEVADVVQSLLKPHDLILVKGSQGARMEKISRALLDPSQSPDQLCRQYGKWLRS